MKKRRSRIRQSDPFMVNTKRAAELIGVTPKTLRLYAATGEIPGRVKLGPRMIRWSIEALRSWIAAQTTKAKGPDMTELERLRAIWQAARAQHLESIRLYDADPCDENRAFHDEAGRRRRAAYLAYIRAGGKD